VSVIKASTASFSKTVVCCKFGVVVMTIRR
jgi:hypothetical protein